MTIQKLAGVLDRDRGAGERFAIIFRTNYFQSVVLRLLFLSLYALIAMSRADATNLNNAARLENEVKGLLDSLFVNGSKADPVTQAIGLRFNSVENEQQLFFKNVCIPYLSSKGFRIEAEADTLMVIAGFDVAICYIERPRFLMGLTSDMERRLRYHLKGWIEDRKREVVLKAFDWQKTVSDTVAANRITQLNRGNYGFLRGREIQASAWSAYLEPALVIGSVSALIYLFFSLRT